MAWSHRLFRPQPMAWSHGSAISLREQIKPKRQTDSISDYDIIILEHASWHQCLGNLAEAKT